MAIKYNREERNTSFFITFTCVKWIALISVSNSHQAFYKWFRYLQTIDVKVSTPAVSLAEDTAAPDSLN